MSKNKLEKEDDLDQSFLDDVLNKLYDFGDESKKRSRSQKKKKRKRCEEEEEEEEVTATNDEGFDNKPTDEDRLAVGPHLESISNNVSAAERTDPGCKPNSQVEVITFQDPKKTPRTQKTPTVPEKKKKPTPPVLNETKRDSKKEDSEKLTLEKARFDVHRFGITGYKKEQQRGLEVERAIMLGARPPKKEYVNYKVYQQTIKDRKQKAREQEPTERKQNRKSNKPREEKKKRSGSAPTGLAGRFKNGMLVLNPKEIQKIKGSRGSR
ncbi:40S small subunit processome assembly factor 1 [Aplochiton taeniatus]